MPQDKQMTEQQINKMWLSLKMISKYKSPEQLRRSSEKDYGLSYEEALEMAYENIIIEAKNGLKGIHLPKSSTQLK